MMYPSASTTICQTEQGGNLQHHTMSSTWPDETSKAEAARARARSQNQGLYRLMPIATADLLSPLLQDDGGSAQLPFRPSTKSAAPTSEL